MGKIVKFCNSCDEGFAEKFGFCPNCGEPLQKFEMNPVAAEAPVEPSVVAPVAATAPLAAPIAAAEPEVASAPEPEIAEADDAYIEPADTGYETVITASPEVETGELEDEPVEIIEPEPMPAATAAPAWTAPAAVFTQTKTMDADHVPTSLMDEHDAYVSDGAFYVTVIEEKNVGKRNMLMLGTLGSMLLVLMIGLVVSIFSKDLDVGSINDDIFNAVLVDDVPAIIEEEVQPKNKDEGGGGGGGGREEEEEVTQGDLADQAKNPTRPPDAKVFRSDNFELKTPPPQTEGDRKFEKKFDRWGDPNGRFASFSNGTGSGGGQGSGVGTGQGSGRGTGAGSGTGSGSGSGIGDGNGDGTGSGGSRSAPPPPPAGVTQQLRIISKPRPGYTDSARQNNVQGTVILRVTFLASGQVGSISAVKGLPNGLTEQAIAAARRISFEPKKIGGVGQPVTRQIEYTFSIY
jgi:periplasmic protein TonB